MLKIALVAVAMIATVTTALAQSSYSRSFFGAPNYGSATPYTYTPSYRPPAKAYKRTSSGQRGTRVIYGHPQRPSSNYYAPMM